MELFLRVVGLAAVALGVLGGLTALSTESSRPTALLEVLVAVLGGLILVGMATVCERLRSIGKAPSPPPLPPKR